MWKEDVDLQWLVGGMGILMLEVDPQKMRKYSALKIWCYIKLYGIFCCVSLPYCLYDLKLTCFFIPLIFITH